MGYFANGTEGMLYEEAYCDRCVHQESGCAVWLLHLLHGYDDCDKPESPIHKLIPRSKDGLGNEKCTMFYPKPDGKAVLIPNANQAAVGKLAGFTFAVDPAIPENEVHLRTNGKTVGIIVNVSK